MAKRFWILAILAMGVGTGCFAQSGSWSVLKQAFDLTQPRSGSDQYFTMETRMVTHAPDGKAVDTTIFRVLLRCQPGAGIVAGGGPKGDLYTCARFTFQKGDGPETAIPSLAGWQHVFRHLAGERDENGQTLGIDHKPFENLVDEHGQPVPPQVSYLVYNVFVDFHSFQVFTDPTASGGGIQDLARIGQKIVHAASHSRPATNLGSSVSAGSYFENGEVTLELKGVSLERGNPCAVIGYDSGASSFLMLMKPAPNIEVRTTGSSHYWGDIYKDLDSQWIRKASLTELVVSETSLPGGQKPMDAVIERSILVLNTTDSGAVGR